MIITTTVPIKLAIDLATCAAATPPAFIERAGWLLAIATTVAQAARTSPLDDRCRLSLSERYRWRAVQHLEGRRKNAVWGGTPNAEVEDAAARAAYWLSHDGARSQHLHGGSTILK